MNQVVQLHSEDNASCLTTCPYCGVGCGVKATLSKGRIIAVSGDEQHPANFGRLCVKGSSLHETTSHKKRLLKPSVNGQEVSWDKAVSSVAKGFSSLINQYGPDSVAMYVSGQLLTEDYYVANKLMKGFIGTANIDTNSRLCMSSSVASYKRGLGEDLVPCDYSDLEKCDLLVLVGSNAAWAHPILYQRMEAAKKSNPNLRLILVDPRRTASADLADLHLPLSPGSDVALFMGLANYLVQESFVDRKFIEQSCSGMTEFEAALDQWSIERVANICQLDKKDLTAFYSLFAENEKVVSFYSQGVNQSSSAVDKSTAIINCHLLTGRIGKEGAGPFSITGQPNAMGGREVGGLANQLAAHMDIDNHIHRERVQRFWNSPTISSSHGLKALDLFEKIHSGEVKAVWIMATNPVVSLPNHEFVKEALKKCELVVVSDMTAETDTAAFADILLPATSWGEKDGTVTNSERRISRQRGLVSGPGEARHDWQVICDVAKEMGFGEAFKYSKPADIFREHAALSGFENDRERFFDISALEEISDEQYEALSPVQWPCPKNMANSPAKPLADGIFPTENGKARLLIVEHKEPAQRLSEERPFRLNSGRIRDQWHTMTRTGRSTRLHNHLDEPYVDIHPDDLARLGAEAGALLELRTDFGSAIMRCRAEKGQTPGQLFVPIHWNRSFASKANVGALFEWIGDPLSGQPESKHGAVSAKVFPVDWQGTFCSSVELDREWLDSVTQFWSKALVPGGFRYQVAGQGDATLWYAHWQKVHDDGETLAKDLNGELRIAQFVGGSLQSLAFFGKSHKPRSMTLFSDLATAGLIKRNEWRQVLSTEAHNEAEKEGAQVCSCFKVGENKIRNAILEGVDTVEALGASLKCGTNCGSCIPEISSLIQECKKSEIDVQRNSVVDFNPVGEST